MKILVIGDLHGKNVWKEFADIKFLLNAEKDQNGKGYIEPEFQKYIFLGDYTDSFNITNVEIKNNLLDVIKFKTLYTDNVILLWGNHDIQYYLDEPWKNFRENKYTCTGMRPEMHFDLYDIFNNNKELFQLAYQVKNYLFSHSGVHFGWYHYTFMKQIKDMNLNDLTVAEQLNEAFKYRLDCLFDIDWYRGGTKKVGGPLWCDKILIEKKPLKNMHQIVGHNIVKEIKTVTNFSKGYDANKGTSITFCDNLDYTDDFYTIEI